MYKKCYNYKLLFTDKPSVCFKLQETCKDGDNGPPNIYLVDEEVELECSATGNPPPYIMWEEKLCSEGNCKFVEVCMTTTFLEHVCSFYF